MPSTLRAGDSAPSYQGDTPPSTRPSSSASTASSSAPHPLRTVSMDSLPTASVSEKVEHIPTRTVGAAPKANAKAMMFVKTGPAVLYRTAAEQMKKAEAVKEMRRLAVREEEEPEWQQVSPGT
ncbi:hypothetical protein FHG87_024210 [Trinorchestia longiramus]|nr:hypothetical protein FHG87_024210 [Trinorchestia longiramus]